MCLALFRRSVLALVTVSSSSKVGNISVEKCVHVRRVPAEKQRFKLPSTDLQLAPNIWDELVATFPV